MGTDGTVSGKGRTQLQAAAQASVTGRTGVILSEKKRKRKELGTNCKKARRQGLGPMFVRFSFDDDYDHGPDEATDLSKERCIIVDQFNSKARIKQ